MRPALTQARLHEVLHYDPATGCFTRRISICHMAKAGAIAGSLNDNGYWRITVDGRRYYAHRLAFFYVTGEWPAEKVDHEGGNRTDNRWLKLRPTTTSENAQNLLRAHGDSITGFLGVSRNGKRFKAQIMVAGKARHIGTFDTPEEAHSAYLIAKTQCHPTSLLAAQCNAALHEEYST